MPLEDEVVPCFPEFPCRNQDCFRVEGQPIIDSLQDPVCYGEVQVPVKVDLSPASPGKWARKEKMFHRFLRACVTHDTQIIIYFTNMASCEHDLRVEPINQNQPCKKFNSRCAFGFPDSPEDWVSFYRIVDERIEPLGSEEAVPVGTPKI